jgi:ankyrin repeat protein
LGRAGDFRFVNLWLEASLPLDPLDERQQTPLMVAAHAGATYMCALFVAKGADVRLQDRDGWTCLHHAVDAGHEKTVEYLCSRAVPLDAQASTNGFTALHITAFHDMRKLAALLLDAGTAARQCAGLAPPPLPPAAARPPAPAFRNSSPVSLPPFSYKPPGASVGLKSTDGKTPLMLANERGSNRFLAAVADKGKFDKKHAGAVSIHGPGKSRFHVRV